MRVESALGSGTADRLALAFPREAQPTDSLASCGSRTALQAERPRDAPRHPRNDLDEHGGAPAFGVIDQHLHDSTYTWYTYSVCSP
jgi:hypothetical protein